MGLRIAVACAKEALTHISVPKWFSRGRKRCCSLTSVHGSLYKLSLGMNEKWETCLFIRPQVDILVNNAGVYFPGSCYNEPEGTLEKLLDINLLSAYHLTRTLLPNMIKNKKGQIFNICSIASLKAYDNGGSYSISKFALAGFTKNLREEMKSFGIKVTGVYPGATMSDSWSGSGVDENRLMEAGDIAKMIHAAAYLSDKAVMEDILLRPQLGDL